MSNPSAGKSGKLLVIGLYAGLILLTLITVQISVKHPKTKAFRQGDLMPLAKCTGFLAGNRLEVIFRGEEEILELLGVVSPADPGAPLAASRDPQHEERVAIGVLQGWIYKKQLVLSFPDEEPPRNEKGHLVSYAELYGVDVGKKLVEEGQAFAANTPHARSELYLEMQRQARERSVGVWR